MKCGKCTICCQWGEDGEVLRPSPAVGIASNGDCEHLIRGVGCAIYHSPLRPQHCQDWDCRELLAFVKGRPLFEIFKQALKMEKKYGYKK